MTDEIIAALSNNDIAKARDLLLTQIEKDTTGKGSWDSPYYALDRSAQEAIIYNPEVSSRATYLGLENLRDRYFLRDKEGKICENPHQFFSRVAVGISRGNKELAQRLYDYMAKGWFSPSTPVLTNAGTSKGLLISCFLNTVPDTLEGIYDTYKENAFLAKYGGGIGSFWGNLRGTNAPLVASGLKSSGIIPFLKLMDASTVAVSRNSTRRGAAAAYLQVDHPDIEDFLEIRKPTGDPDRRCLNLNHGVVITDKFMQAVEADTTYELVDPHFKTVSKVLNAKDVWRKILKLRVETGEPYMLFIDTVNKAVPEHHKEKDLYVNQSNLCVEITLPTTEDRTAVCCLSSLNLETYDEWKDDLDQIVKDVVTSLDNNLESFIETASEHHAKAVNSAMRERSIGLGVMGWHGYLMANKIPFESVIARALNKQIFKSIGDSAKKASTELGVERGLPLDGGTQRNSYVMAIAPTASISFICGEATPGIEPLAGNAFVQKTLSGSFLTKNKYLVKLLEEKGKNTPEIWSLITNHKGSVQGLEFLSEQEKAVFRTAVEINQRELIQQAADRQPFICQSQSLNLFFPTPVSGKYLDEVHKMAWKEGVKSLYYVRSEAPISSSIGEATAWVVKERDLANEECAVCQ